MDECGRAGTQWEEHLWWERSVLKARHKNPYLTHSGEVQTCTLYIDRGLTAESLLQASELHGCSVGWEANVVQVSWRQESKKQDETDLKREETVESPGWITLAQPKLTASLRLHFILKVIQQCNVSHEVTIYCLRIVWERPSYPKTGRARPSWDGPSTLSGSGDCR